MIEPKVIRVADSVFRNHLELRFISEDFGKGFMLTEVMRSKGGDWILLLEPDATYEMRNARQDDKKAERPEEMR
jgi:hypothetical protein